MKSEAILVLSGGGAKCAAHCGAMNALRERGLADAGRLARARGFGNGTITLTPVSGSIRCEGSTSAVVFRVASHDGLNGRAWSSNLVSRLPGAGVPSSGLRSTR